LIREEEVDTKWVAGELREKSIDATFSGKIRGS
jgi:hypothetical protein